MRAKTTLSILLFGVCQFGFGGSALAATVNIDANTNYQTIRGFGGMNGAGWIDTLTSDQVNTAFGNSDGQMGLSIMRMRIDPDSDNWSKQVSAAQQAVANGAKLLATPWTPPAYMKSNNSLIKGGTLLSQYYSAYADHLLKFAEYMASSGASLYAISLQNEPDWSPDYESCKWTGNDFVNFLLSQGSRFDSYQLVAPESLNFNHSFSDPFLKNDKTVGFVDIIGGHLYGTKAKDYPLARSKGKELWMTEHTLDTKISANDWPQALEVGTDLHQSMTANFNAYIWWYIRRSYGLLTDDGKISKRGYMMAQYSKFVRPGFIRIAATESPLDGVHVTAYKGSDDKVVVVAVNTTGSHQKIDLNLNNVSAESFVKYSTSSKVNLGYGGSNEVSGNKVSLWIDPQSVATFVGKGVSFSDGSTSDNGNGGNKIEVRMKGNAGGESVSLQVGGKTLRTWTLGKSMNTYNLSSDATGEIRVAFTNDGGKRDVQVDYVSVKGKRRQAEDQDDNTGVWGNGSCGGGSYSEWLHCNGSIGFGDVGGSSSTSDTQDSTSNDSTSSDSTSNDSTLNDSTSNDSKSNDSTSNDSKSNDSTSNNSTSKGDGVTATLKITNDWTSGYCAKLVIKNETGSSVNWRISLPVDGAVSNLWNGTWTQSGSVLTVFGLGWNKTLQAGQTNDSVGFCANR